MITKIKAVSFCKCGRHLIKDLKVEHGYIKINSIKGIHKCKKCGRIIEFRLMKSNRKGNNV